MPGRHAHAPSCADLVRRLRSARRTEQLQAAERITTLVRTADSTAQCCEALAAAGAVAPLVALLRASSLALRAYAAMPLFYMAQGTGLCDDVCEAVAGSDGIPALVALLEARGGSAVAQPLAHMGAAGVLRKLADRPAYASALLAAGAVPASLRLWADCRQASGLLWQPVEQLLLCAVCQLATDPATCAAVAAAGPVPALARALQLHIDARDGDASASGGSASGGVVSEGGASSDGGSGSEADPEAELLFSAAEAAGALAALLLECPALTAAALEAGVPAACVRLLGLEPHPPPQLYGLLGTLARDGTEAVVAAGGLCAFIRGLNSGGGGGGGDGGSSEDAEHAVTLAVVGLMSCVQAGPALRAEVLASGAVPALLRLVGAADADVRAMAADILSNLGAAAAAANKGPGGSSAKAAAKQPAGGSQPKAQPPRVCAAPGCDATRGLRRCGGCGMMRYCGEACSRAHWREHRAQCRRLQAEQQQQGQQQQVAA